MMSRIRFSKWTVKICRQSIELDSPVHQENLMCTGDYLVESLVNNYTTGDYSLTRFDLVRMANYFVARNGFKYHTSYSLSWVLMLYDYYMYSGDESIFPRVKEGLEKMLKRFKTYENDEGIIEKAPNFMFVDWSYVDGYGLNHPPRALGETVMNALYYEAITLSAKIYEILGEAEKANEYSEKSKKLKEAFNRNFYDPEKKMYFDGRNIPNEVNPCMPENSKKRYYTIYSNTLAVLFDLCGPSESSEIMDKIVGNEEMLIAQPYFLHFVIEAVYKVGLFEKYGLKLIRKWKKLVEECEKGLKEVLYDFKGYEIDYSHGWGATPAYQLPSKIAGIEILEPGFRKIRLNPNLYGLDYANIKIPTPYGTIACEIKQDNISISVPDEIEVVKDRA